jgi:hypothetical protein
MRSIDNEVGWRIIIHFCGFVQIHGLFHNKSKDPWNWRSKTIENVIGTLWTQRTIMRAVFTGIYRIYIFGVPEQSRCGNPYSSNTLRLWQFFLYLFVIVTKNIK